MREAADDNFLDVYYSCIPIPSISGERDLTRAINSAASELYETSYRQIAEAVGRGISKQAWIKRAQRMIKHVEYDAGSAYVAVKAIGPTSERHAELVDLLATHLMSKAPQGSFTQRMSISSDPSLCSVTFPWLIYQNGQLIDRDTVDVLPARPDRTIAKNSKERKRKRSISTSHQHGNCRRPVGFA
jgi:hypothetical protein